MIQNQSSRRDIHVVLEIVVWRSNLLECVASRFGPCHTRFCVCPSVPPEHQLHHQNVDGLEHIGSPLLLLRPDAALASLLGLLQASIACRLSCRLHLVHLDRNGRSRLLCHFDSLARTLSQIPWVNVLYMGIRKPPFSLPCFEF